MEKWYSSEKIQCTNDEKKECLETINTILKLSEKTRKYGLLSLEDEASKNPDFLMRKGLLFVVDGIEPEFIREVLGTYIFAGNYVGKELLKRILVKEGVLLIQKGEHPLMIRERLTSFLGENYADEVEKYFNMQNEKQDNSKIKNTAPISEETALLEGLFEKIDNIAIQRILKETQILDVVKAIKGASNKVQDKIYINMSKRSASQVKDMVETTTGIETKDMVEAQLKIIDIVKKLQEKGDIK